ncbi:MAG TPA: BON domain-containing protein [Candidatus Limnocylindria bacterium]|nr:BON domain-containing protein [Candidatus Limnocylindria bacterium]
MPMLETKKKSDRDIQLDVLAEIDRDRRYEPAEIGVEVDDGVVTLVGTVSTYAKLLDAADIAARVSGVKDVANDLVVQVAPQYAKDDTALAKQIRSALEWAPDVPDANIDSIVRMGIVTLKGTVDHWYEKIAAADAVRKIAGVISVSNDILVRPEVRSDIEIFEDIRGALMRRMPHVSKDIDLTVDRGAVTLMGTLSSYLDRRHVEDIAWTARGVKEVRDRIQIVW